MNDLTDVSDEGIALYAGSESSAAIVSMAREIQRRRAADLPPEKPRPKHVPDNCGTWGVRCDCGQSFPLTRLGLEAHCAHVLSERGGKPTVLTREQVLKILDDYYEAHFDSDSGAVGLWISALRKAGLEVQP